MEKLQLTEFYKKEYEVLSQAHFQATQRITSFFQYALIILSAPIALFKLTEATNKTLIPFICLAISVVGLFVVLYIGQLRSEAILYARCVNNIRRYFYENSNLEFEEHISKSVFFNEYSVLLTHKKIPKFWDGEQFVLIILALGTINSSYFGYSIFNLINEHLNRINMHEIIIFNYKAFILSFSPLSFSVLCSIISAVIYFGLHFFVYYIQTRKNECGTRFFKHIFGMDIDGVLNKHKEQFVNIYNQLVDSNKITSEKISIMDIKTIPVQDFGKIKSDNANKVFTVAEYWSDMPVNDDASQVINEMLINRLGYNIHIFTSRDWKPKDSQNKSYNIKKGTKKWLQKNNIPYKKIKFEKGNYDSPIGWSGALYNNRFYLSAKRKIEFFIEDEPAKARKLANICRYVFLIDQPYNQEEDQKCPFPHNVIRIMGWKELQKIIKDFI